MRFQLLTLACVIAIGSSARAQSPDTSAVTSLSGIYTAEQATKGQDIYSAACLSCHKPVEFSGERFWKTLIGRPLYEFFKYVKTDMPGDNPGSLGDEDYANVISYIFTLNSMPAGQKAMPTDSATLSKIMVVAPATPGSAVPPRFSSTGRRK
jgi:mono/diheme cytochrome c family protein